MSTQDQDFEPYLQASHDALMASLRSIQGDRSAAAEADAAFARLDGCPNILAVIGGWYGPLALFTPTGPSANFSLAAFDNRTNEQVNPDGEFPPDLLLAARLGVAVRNKDWEAAAALWSTAVDMGRADDVLMTVLILVAKELAHHLAARSAT